MIDEQEEDVYLEKQEELRERVRPPELPLSCLLIDLQQISHYDNQHLGDWQGHAVAERTTIPANAEQASDFAARAITWWDEIIVPYATHPLPEDRTDPWNILVVSHGGFIGTIVTNLIGRGRMRCADGVIIGRCWNGSLTEIELGEDEKATVVRYADISHLTEGAVEENADVQE